MYFENTAKVDKHAFENTYFEIFGTLFKTFNSRRSICRKRRWIVGFDIFYVAPLFIRGHKFCPQKNSNSSKHLCDWRPPEKCESMVVICLNCFNL